MGRPAKFVGRRSGRTAEVLASILPPARTQDGCSENHSATPALPAPKPHDDVTEVRGRRRECVRAAPPCAWRTGAIARLPLGSLGPEASAEAFGPGLVAVVRAAGTMPPALALKVACNVWSLGPSVVSCPLCGADSRPDFAHIFSGDGFHWLRRGACSAVAAEGVAPLRPRCEFGAGPVGSRHT